MSIPNVTIGKQINYGNKYRFTFFNDSYFQLIFYHDVRSGNYYFNKVNVKRYFGQYTYSLLSDLEAESLYKTDNKYEFILHYPELGLDEFNWWRQSLSPTIQTEDNLQNETGTPLVLGYENISVKFTTNNWGGLSLSKRENESYINGDVSPGFWFYSIGNYGIEKGIPGPTPTYLKQVALYVKITSLDMIRCISCRFCRNFFLNFPEFLCVIIVL
ncbi:hypothetical protein TVAG_409670 [Trichomonas vaginalis G3]|uniref:Uncharacterized protein n=1 Tax=Trichomonas vaginalis (strain ATCC PRA-98 / G3) TaxID=412133 RepID=A2F8C7_TRIV3|nr:leucine-rich repeat extensin-like protein family [Trichomonas vaginalis G3]EAX98829.1 hypothetical protein TVAG_409670 [Trichomonas vaginalis G3]KAI5532249.1 leucine-rich repeat extensin-like protein family [Trichomonas vaginalis G3]|eukprot:XP_001311759.1 hypothetical protein [Trichomonas vaginalis G3]